MKKNKKLDIKSEYLVQIFIFTYLFINPTLALMLGIVCFLLKNEIIYLFLLISPLLENISPLMEGMTISKIFGIVYVGYFCLRFLKKKISVNFYSIEVLLYYFYFLILILGCYKALSYSSLIMTSSSEIFKENISLFLVIINSFILFIDFSNKYLSDIKLLVNQFSICLIPTIFMMVIYNSLHSIEVIVWGATRQLYAGSDPNEYSVILVSFITFLLYSAYNNKNKILQTISVVCIILCTITILNTASKGGLLTLIFLSLTSIIYFINSNKKRIKILVFMLLGIILFWYFNEDTVANIISRFTMFDGNLQEVTTGRLDFWINGVTYTLKNDFLFGAGGSGKYEIYVNRIADLSPLKMHSIYISLFVKYGCIGLTLFLMLVIRPILDITINKRKYNNNYIIFTLSLMVLLFAGISLSWDYNSVIWVTIGISNGILFSLKKSKYGKETKL